MIGGAYCATEGKANPLVAGLADELRAAGSVGGPARIGPGSIRPSASSCSISHSALSTIVTPEGRNRSICPRMAAEFLAMSSSEKVAICSYLRQLICLRRPARSGVMPSIPTFSMPWSAG